MPASTTVVPYIHQIIFLLLGRLRRVQQNGLRSLDSSLNPAIASSTLRIHHAYLFRLTAPSIALVLYVRTFVTIAMQEPLVRLVEMGGIHASLLADGRGVLRKIGGRRLSCMSMLANDGMRELSLDISRKSPPAAQLKASPSEVQRCQPFSPRHRAHRP